MALGVDERIELLAPALAITSVPGIVACTPTVPDPW
jgi:hypothetical protein